MDRFDSLTVVVLEEQGMWVGVGLEQYISGCGDTYDGLVSNMADQCQAVTDLDREEGREPWSHFKRAPEEFWRMAEQGCRTFKVALDYAGLPTLEELQVESVPVTRIEDAVE